jgi:hypothetical protein
MAGFVAAGHGHGGPPPCGSRLAIKPIAKCDVRSFSLWHFEKH